jgi:hypothetical protein
VGHSSATGSPLPRRGEVDFERSEKSGEGVPTEQLCFKMSGNRF